MFWFSLPLLWHDANYRRRQQQRPPNALPFSGLGAAKPALRFYADASAATKSAATACSPASVLDALARPSA